MGSNAIPNLVNPGGVAPSAQQTALSQFNLGQGQIGAMSRYGSHGIGESTMETQAGVSGPEAKFAQDQGLASLQDTQAIQNFVNQQATNFASGLGGILGAIGGKGGAGGG